MSTRSGTVHTLGYTILGLLIAIVVYFVALLLIHGSADPSGYRIDSQWSAFTGLFILALGIERAIEPFSSKLGPDTDELQRQRDQKLGELDTESVSTEKSSKSADAARAQSRLDLGRRLTGVVIWGVATALGFLLCAGLNLTLLEAIRANTSDHAPFWADLLVTGLVVGAGTKPLHDLVSSLEKSKNKKKDPAQVGGDE